jgi:phosphoribosylformimino-5-aminoimidazole carboxamide ribotide isomerase
MKALPGVEIIASGGISSMEDILKLNEMGVPGVITGKAIYENKITLKEIGRFLG